MVRGDTINEFGFPCKQNRCLTQTLHEVDTAEVAAPIRTRSIPIHPDERERLIWARARCGWVQAKVARLLRLAPRQMAYALQKNRNEVGKF